MILAPPRTPIVANQTSITGPNSLPMLPVPRRCAAKSAISTSTDSHTTALLNSAFASSSPSIALNTDTAGVIVPSP